MGLVPLWNRVAGIVRMEISEVLTDVPALGHQNAEEEEDKQDACTTPSVGRIWRNFIEVRLIHLVQEVPLVLAVNNVFEESHTRPNLLVCALTAAKGVSSGSGASMLGALVAASAFIGEGTQPAN